MEGSGIKSSAVLYFCSNHWIP